LSSQIPRRWQPFLIRLRPPPSFPYPSHELPAIIISTIPPSTGLARKTQRRERKREEASEVNVCVGADADEAPEGGKDDISCLLCYRLANTRVSTHTSHVPLSLLPPRCLFFAQLSRLSLIPRCTSIPSNTRTASIEMWDRSCTQQHLLGTNKHCTIRPATLVMAEGDLSPLLQASGEFG